MSVDYAVKYSQKISEAFSLGSLTNSLVNQDYDWVGVSTVYVYSIPTVALGNYTVSGANRYGTPSELSGSAQELTVSQDKAFTFTIDRKSYDDTVMTMQAGAALAREINEVVIPAIDTYRLSAIAAGAPANHVKTLATTSANAYAEFLAVQEILDNSYAPQGGRICAMTPGFLNKIKQDEAFIKRGDMATKIAINGQVGEIDGVPCIKVPTSYMPTNVDFIITNRMVAPSPVKLQEYKIHSDAPGISGWLVEGRVRYDCFVLSNKAAAIGVHKSAT